MSTSPRQIVQQLKARLERYERREQGDRPRVGSGCAALDRLLPGGGFVRGSLVEWLGTGAGSGAATLAMLAAREALRESGPLVVIDRRRWFYPPAANLWNISESQIILVRPRNEADEHWALDQALRSPAAGAVLARVERLESGTFRRLQLAAESGGSLGLLIRPAAARREPTWSAVRWLVRPLPAPAEAHVRRLHVELIRYRGGLSQGAVEVEIDAEGNVRGWTAAIAQPDAKEKLRFHRLQGAAG